MFAKYWYGFRSGELVQEVDVIQGAFFLTRKDLLDKVDWFSEDYFLDGEDIDLCWKIKDEGYEIIYYPDTFITHLKKATKRKFKDISVGRGVDSMEIFYRKYLWNKYPFVLNLMVLAGIRLIKLVRLLK